MVDQAINVNFINVEGLAVTLVYVDATKGWLVTDSGLQSRSSTTSQFVTATGGTITTVIGILKFIHLQDQVLLQYVQCR